MSENELSEQDIDALFNSPATVSDASTAGAGEAAPQKPPAQAAAPTEPAQPHPQAPNPEPSVSVLTKPLEKEPVEARPVEFSPLTGQSEGGEVRKIDFLLDVPVTITVELGRTAMVIRDALSLGSGSVIELNKLAGEPVDLLINNKLVARGEVVVVNENFGVKVADIASPEERLRYLR